MDGPKMFNKDSLKLGLTGAILFIIMGSFTACADGGPTEPSGPQYTQNGTCVLVNGVWMCN